jgi:hypothetical protein
VSPRTQLSQPPKETAAVPTDLVPNQERAAQVKWEHLREVPARGLQPGDRWITLVPGTVCWVLPDGRIRGHFVDEPGGTVWPLPSWDGDTATATSDDGDRRSQQIPITAKVNRIVTCDARGR